MCPCLRHLKQELDRCVTSKGMRSTTPSKVISTNGGGSIPRGHSKQSRMMGRLLFSMLAVPISTGLNVPAISLIQKSCSWVRLVNRAHTGYNAGK
ncbi:hypothetical protein MPTK2_Ug00268 [Marchantia polymorpha subsp. ruderalis]|uniref:Uncharacterized protein n=1 Tax=Marchantia polymorpha TaxID=3197 RepID=A0A2R6VZG1_MARPO|nr:hypothetical protein MARPO_0250s0001 [Marchantia polymorpha]|eukprot:PTQ26979.1 hypothetical protein MARPO_0250s0001 [Marchantia polymorpha]